MALCFLWGAAVAVSRAAITYCATAAHIFEHTVDQSCYAANGQEAAWGDEQPLKNLASGQAVPFYARATARYCLKLELNRVSGDLDVCARIR
jgi:hypothetical protein